MPILSPPHLPPPIQNKLLSAIPSRLSNKHTGSTGSLQTYGANGKGSLTDEHSTAPRKIYPPEQRRRSSTSMLNINMISSSYSGESNYNNNNSLPVGMASKKVNDIATKKRKWYKKLLISPQNTFKLTTGSDTDLSKHSQNKEKKKWFRKKISITHI